MKVYLVHFVLLHCMFQFEFELLLGKPIFCEPYIFIKYGKGRHLKYLRLFI